MATLKEVQLKIAGVKKTKQITKAMQMVAASKLRGAQAKMENFRPYAAKFAEVLGSLAESAGDNVTNPLLEPREDIKNIHIVLCTSDRGLCGGFNANLIEKAEAVLGKYDGEDVNLSITCFGKRGRDWSRKKGLEIASEHINVVGAKFGFNIASIEGQNLVERFLAGDFDEVYVIYSEFAGMGRQVSVVKQLLPIPQISSVEEIEEDTDNPYQPEHICEPSPSELMGDMLPRNVYIQLFSALLETSTSEHAARMAAMDNATKACNDLVSELTMVFNKARQAAITADLMDIIGGAEALKG